MSALVIIGYVYVCVTGYSFLIHWGGVFLIWVLKHTKTHTHIYLERQRE